VCHEGIESRETEPAQRSEQERLAIGSNSRPAHFSSDRQSDSALSADRYQEERPSCRWTDRTCASSHWLRRYDHPQRQL